MFTFIHIIISSVLSPFHKEITLWAADVFPFHVVAAGQFGFSFIPMWADPLHSLHINRENDNTKDSLFLLSEVTM